jgi:hypothetical protein
MRLEHILGIARGIADVIEYVATERIFAFKTRIFSGCHPYLDSRTGATSWYSNGKLHREDGPAEEWINGDKFWFKNGKLHREDGPAKKYVCGRKEWWLNGECCYHDHQLRIDGTHNVDKEGCIILERDIPTCLKFGDLKITMARVLTSRGTFFVPSNLPGFVIED